MLWMISTVIAVVVVSEMSSMMISRCDVEFVVFLIEVVFVLVAFVIVFWTVVRLLASLCICGEMVLV